MTLTNFNEKLGMPYGVIHQNSLHPDLMDDILRLGDDLYRESVAEQVREVLGSIDAIALNDLEDECVDAIMDILDDDCLSLKDGCGDIEYVDNNGVVYLTTETDVFITKSKWVCRCRHCSPCVPGAGDLDSPDENGMLALCPCPDEMQEVANYHDKTYFLETLDGQTIIIHPEKGTNDV